jgi:hypothetical protein
MRAALAALISSNLVGAGKPLQAVYAYNVGDFQGQSPVTTVTSGGTRRYEGDYGVEFENEFYLVINNYVLYADPGTGWGEDDAEERLDLIEQSLANLFKTNRSHPSGTWEWLEYDGRSQVIEAIIGGEMYLVEMIPVKVTENDNN